MAAKLKRPALLDPVRQNLRALMYLLHADGEVVTEISRRQDQYTRGGLAGYWFPLTYLAVADRDGQLRDDGATGGGRRARSPRCWSIRSCRSRCPRRSRCQTTTRRSFGRSASRASVAGRSAPRSCSADRAACFAPLRRRGHRGRALRDVLLRQGAVRPGHRREGRERVPVPPVARGAVPTNRWRGRSPRTRGRRRGPSAARPRSIASSRPPR